jgi:xanthine dehydrogenase accessory factor
MIWLDALAAHARWGRPAVLVTVLDARGPTPREAGTKMVVAAKSLDGTIGGGRLEQECVESARALLEGGASAPVLREFPLGPALGQCCGGQVRVLLEPVLPPAWQVGLFGAGHVGRAVARLLADLPCRLHWIDAREEAFPETLPSSVVRIVAEQPELRVAALPAGAQMLVMTHDHALDYRIVSACLARGDLAFVGLIGSATKAARFRSRLARDGVPAGAIGRMVCPIGLPGTGGKLPAEIAIATVAQLLQRRDRAPAMEDTMRDNVRRLPAPAPGCGAENCESCRAIPA